MSEFKEFVRGAKALSWSEKIGLTAALLGSSGALGMMVWVVALQF